MIRHRLSPLTGGEHAYCGEAFDAFATGNSDEEGIFMDVDDMRPVTCPNCCEAIAAIRDNLRGVRLRPRKTREIGDDAAGYDARIDRAALAKLEGKA